MKRLAAVVVLALAGFAASLAQFGSGGARDCLSPPRPQPGYAARFVGRVMTAQTAHVLAVTHDGRPLGAARVCVNTEMRGMTGMGMTARARPLGPGRYRVALRFPMAGEWRATVLVTPARGEPVTVPVKVRVGGGGSM